jgi:peroxiredoxin
MDKSRLFTLLVIICLAAPAIALAEDASSPYAVDRLVMDKPAPEFTINDMDGKPVSLSSYRGRPVLIFFWASWCPTSSAEFVSLNKLHSMYRDKGLTIIAISTDKKVQAAKAFLEKNPVSFPVLYDERLRVSKKLYKAFMIPMAFLVDNRGVVVKKRFGQQSWTEPEIIKDIDSLLR